MGSRGAFAAVLFTATSLVGAPAALAAGTCAGQFLDGKPPTSPAQHTTPLCYREFAVLYSSVTRTPVWSAEHLTAARVRKASTLPRHFPKAKFNNNSVNVRALRI